MASRSGSSSGSDSQSSTSDITSGLADAQKAAQAFSSALGTAFTEVALKGKSVSDAISSITAKLGEAAVSSALKPLENSLTSLLTGLGQGLISGGGVSSLSAFGSNASSAANTPQPFADGGIVSTPSYFPNGNGLGLAGEAGAEAILPLSRGPDGGLGVRMHGDSGSSPVSVTFNVSTPDVEGFRRSEASVTAQLARAVQRGQRSS